MWNKLLCWLGFHDWTLWEYKDHDGPYGWDQLLSTMPAIIICRHCSKRR